MGCPQYAQFRMCCEPCWASGNGHDARQDCGGHLLRDGRVCSACGGHRDARQRTGRGVRVHGGLCANLQAGVHPLSTDFFSGICKLSSALYITVEELISNSKMYVFLVRISSKRRSVGVWVQPLRAAIRVGTSKSAHWSVQVWCHHFDGIKPECQTIWVRLATYVFSSFVFCNEYCYIIQRTGSFNARTMLRHTSAELVYHGLTVIDARFVSCACKYKRERRLGSQDLSHWIPHNVLYPTCESLYMVSQHHAVKLWELGCK